MKFLSLTSLLLVSSYLFCSSIPDEKTQALLANQQRSDSVSLQRLGHSNSITVVVADDRSELEKVMQSQCFMYPEDQQRARAEKIIKAKQEKNTFELAVITHDVTCATLKKLYDDNNDQRERNAVVKKIADCRFNFFKLMYTVTIPLAVTLFLIARFAPR